MRDGDQRVRYSRHVKLPAVGEAGQNTLLASKVLVVGAGGLGSPLLLYLAASGIGTLGIADGDRVELSNLQRQVVHETADVGRNKAESACDTVLDLNPDIHVVIHPHLTADNIEAIISAYDVVADGCDNFETRFLVNRTCHMLGKTLVSAAVTGFAGQLSTFKSYLGAPHPCYQCLYPDVPPAEIMPSCAENGVLSPLTGMMGAWQGVEVVKELLQLGQSLSGTLIRVDALGADVRRARLRRDTECATCGAGAAKTIPPQIRSCKGA